VAPNATAVARSSSSSAQAGAGVAAGSVATTPSWSALRI
jgi:hypothetical protein